MRRLANYWSIGVSDSLLEPGLISAMKRFLVAVFIVIPVWFGWLEL